MHVEIHWHLIGISPNGGGSVLQIEYLRYKENLYLNAV
jgi:hypothetical protein